MEEIKIKFKLRLNIPKWGKYVEGNEDYFYIDIFNESNGLVRHPIEKHWDIISYELVKNNGVLDDVSKPLAPKEVKSCMKADLKCGEVCKEHCGASWC